MFLGGMCSVVGCLLCLINYNLFMVTIGLIIITAGIDVITVVSYVYASEVMTGSL